jgi:hypothetical protein
MEVDLEGDPLSMQSLTGSLTALKSPARAKRPLEFANSITEYSNIQNSNLPFTAPKRHEHCLGKHIVHPPSATTSTDPVGDFQRFFQVKPEEAVVEMGGVILELVATGSYETALLCLKSLRGAFRA